MCLNFRWSVDWKSMSSQHRHGDIPHTTPHIQAWTQSLHIFPHCMCTKRNMSVLRLTTQGAWLLGFLPGDFPTWLLQEADLLFSQRRPNVIKEEKAASKWESRRKVGPKILNRSFYWNRERKMVFLGLIHLLQTLLVLMPPCSFLDSVRHPHRTPSLLVLEISEW